MKSNNLWGRIVAVAAVLALVGVGAVSAQLQSGNLYGSVLDEQGAPLPGVTVTLTGQGAPQVQVTNAQGQFRFLGLGPGEYSLKAELEGFSTIEYPSISINVGRNTEISVTLSAAVEDVITVTAESPLLDERKISTGATISHSELEKIPSARDPWAVLQSTPGVLTDRINVGGNESGQQSQYVGPGSGGDQAVWSVDGVVITDMAALGSSPAYYDFDSFEEMQVTTGGSDSSLATGGVVLNMVTKRGTNEWRGTGRYLLTDQDWQSDSDTGSVEFGRDFDGPSTVQGPFKQGNRIVDVKDFGIEIGGPIIKDRLWIWGAYAKNEIDLLTIADVSDFTELETQNLKLNAQLAPSNSATAFFMNSDKVKIGRNAGPTRPQATTWNQSKFGDDPTAAKLEDTHIFSSNFYLTGLFSIVNGGFQLAPQGGLGPSPYLDGNGVWNNTFLLYQTERPQEQFKLDASNFFNTGSLSHELKFGAGYRNAEVTSVSTWGGNGITFNGPAFFGLPAGLNAFGLTRDGGPSVEQEYTNLYLQDTLSVGNLTANIGIRYDKQEGTNLARTIGASALLPNVLPAVSVSSQDIGFSWERITPRLGLTYALGKERKTLLRASYSRFADQLGTGFASQLNPLGAVSYAYFITTNPGNGNVGVNQLLNPSSPEFGFSGNVNPFTGGLLQSNSVASDFNAPLTDEVLLGVEHALLPEFVVGLNFTFRKLTEIAEGESLIFDGSSYSPENINRIGRIHQRSDYTPVNISGVLPDGSTYATQVWLLKPQFSSRGTQLENGDRESEYTGTSLVFNKRLSNQWMLRGNFTLADWEWSSVPDSEIQNPTEFLGGGSREGDAVLQGSGNGSGAKGGIYINSGWSYSVNGLYQIAPDKGWGFNAALNLNGREGYAVPYWRRIQLDANQNFGAYSASIVPDPDSYRLDDIHMIDARLEKEFNFNDFGLTVGIDGFNLFNEAYVLQRNHRVGQGTSNHVREITSPRIFRVGARLSFR